MRRLGLRRAGRVGYLVVAAVIATACASGSSSSPTGQGNSLITMTPPAKHDVSTVTWNLPHGEPFSLDWTLAYGFSENQVVANMCDSLLRLQPDYKIAPGLAMSYSNPTPTTWVYNIRPGVTFWDGKPLTATDVAYSLSRNLAETSYWNVWYTGVQGIAETGPLQVTVTLKQPNYLFNEIMAVDGGDVGEKAYVEAKGKAYGTSQGGVMCTGPFKFSSWIPGQSITLVKNPNYWDPALRPRAGEIRFSFLSDAATITSALQSGELDGTYEPPYGSIIQLRDSGVVNVYAGPSLEVNAIYSTDSPGPFHNPLIRKALLMAVDRQAIATSLFGGFATPLRSYAPPTSFGYARSVFEQSYANTIPPTVNLAGARQLVQQAGSPTGKIVIAALNTNLTEQEGTVIVSAGRSIGLNIELKILPPNLFDNLFFTKEARASVSGILESTYPDVADPLELYELYFTPTTPYNYANFINQDVASSLDQALQTSDETARAKLIVKAQSVLDDNVVWVPLVSYQNVVVMNKRITGPPAAFDWGYYPWAATIGGS